MLRLYGRKVVSFYSFTLYEWSKLGGVSVVSTNQRFEARAVKMGVNNKG